MIVACETRGGRVIVLDSLTHCDARLTARDVVVAGSFAGPLAFAFALARGVRAIVAHAAGIGLDDAGVAGLSYASRFGVAAAAVETMSARLGDGASVLADGIIARANAEARAVGVVPGLPARVAAERLLAVPPGRPVPALAPLDREERVVAETPAGRIVLLGSTSFAGPAHHPDVLCVGSHGGAVNAVPLRGVRPRGVIFNDGGRARDDSGLGALPLLDALGVAAAAVDANSARIGEPASTWATGVVSACNAAAHRCGVRPGLTAARAAALMLHNAGNDAIPAPR